MANQDKKQQRREFMYIYKGGIANQRKKECELAAGDVQNKSSARIWLPIISKVPSLNVVKGGKRGFEAGAEGFVETRKSTSIVELGTTEGYVEERNSVSQIETCSSVAAYLQVKVLVSDMPSFMRLHASRLDSK